MYQWSVDGIGLETLISIFIQLLLFLPFLLFVITLIWYNKYIHEPYWMTTGKL